MESRSIQRQVLMVEDTASVAALYKSYLNPLGLMVNIVGGTGDGSTQLRQRHYSRLNFT